MKLSLVLLVILCSALVSYNVRPSGSTDIQTYRPTTNDDLKTALEKRITVALDLAQAIEKHDLQSILTLASALVDALGHLGPFASIISNIIKLFDHHDKDLEELKNQLNMVNSKLFALDKKLDKLIDEVKIESIISGYKRYVDNLDTLEYFYKRYSTNPTNNTHDDFVRVCHQNKMIEVIVWLHKEICLESIQSLIWFMGEDYDQAKFIDWSRMILSRYMQATLLHTVCVGITDPSQVDRDRTLKVDSEDFRNKTQQMQSRFDAGVKQIKQGYFKYAQGEVELMMAENPQMEHDKFSNKLYSFLANKYPWRLWIVASYSGQTAGNNNHYVSYYTDKAQFWKRVHNRCLMVSSTNNHDSDFKALDSHVTQYTDNVSTDCQKVVDDISKSFNKYDAVMCVHFGNGLRATYVTNDGISFVNYKNKISVLYVKADSGPD